MFGRFNPVTSGHVISIEHMMKWCHENDADNLVVPTKTQNRKTDPLTFIEKKKSLQNCLDKSVNIDSWNMNNIFKLLDKFETLGYKKVVMFVGHDRVDEFKMLFDKYVTAPTYNFSIEVKDSGKRTKGISGSDQRNYAIENDYDSFEKNCPKQMTSEFKRHLFDMLQARLNK